MFKSVCAFKGADLNIYMCAWIKKKHKGQTDWGAVVETKTGNTKTNHTGEACSPQGTYRIKSLASLVFIKMKPPVCQPSVFCHAQH